MAFKITPVVDRQKQYASAVWDFFVDGGTTAISNEITTSAAAYNDYRLTNLALNPTTSMQKITDDDRVINFLFSGASS